MGFDTFPILEKIQLCSAVSRELGGVMASQADETNSVGASEELSRGHKKKARTRQQLVETALRIFAQCGVADVSLNRLADEAGVSHGTVYNHFRTRDEMLEAVGIAMAEEFSREIIAISVGLTGGAERLSIGVRSFVRKAQRNPEWGSALVRVVRHTEGLRTILAAQMRADLEAGARQGDFRFAGEELAMALVAAATTSAISTLLEGHAVEHHDSVTAEMILLALGVPTAKARRIATRPLPTAPIQGLPGHVLGD